MKEWGEVLDEISVGVRKEARFFAAAHPTRAPKRAEEKTSGGFAQNDGD
jgi:hypothetical protein